MKIILSELERSEIISEGSRSGFDGYSVLRFLDERNERDSFSTECPVSGEIDFFLSTQKERTK